MQDIAIGVRGNGRQVWEVCKLEKVSKRFVYPEKDVIERSRQSTNSYANQIIGTIFWNRFKTGFSMLKGHLMSTQKTKYDTIIEIGTSYGFFLPSLCELANRVIGTDTEGTFNFCKDLTLYPIKRSCPNLTLKSADATHLSDFIEPNSCDVIVAFSVLEHIEDARSSIGEISKCLKDDGVFLCELPTENRLYRLSRKIARYNEAHPGYSYDDVKRGLEQDFDCLAERNSPFGLPLFNIGLYSHH
jgi:SAM-dependent methyltransferase